MHKVVLVAVTLVMTSGVVTPALAGGSWKNSDHKKQKYTQDKAKSDAFIEVGFSNYDRALINQYYSYGKPTKMPPGLAKKNHLPPGLQKQIKKNGKLPPGLEGRYLPDNLERKLGYLPRGSVRIRVGKDILLVDIPTKTILDVIEGIAF